MEGPRGARGARARHSRFEAHRRQVDADPAGVLSARTPLLSVLGSVPVARRAGADPWRHHRARPGHGRRWRAQARLCAANPLHRRDRRRLPQAHHRHRPSGLALDRGGDRRAAAQEECVHGYLRLASALHPAGVEVRDDPAPAGQDPIRVRLPGLVHRAMPRRIADRRHQGRRHGEDLPQERDCCAAPAGQGEARVGGAGAEGQKP